MRRSRSSNGTFATLHSASVFSEIQTIAMAVHYMRWTLNSR